MMVNIAVLVKQVPDTNAKIVVQGGNRVDLSGVKMVISPYDEFAIENALLHQEAQGGTVTAITVGDGSAEKILKDAKAIGVDELIRIDVSQEMDSNALQHVLVEAIQSIGAEVVYCGKSAADTGAGSTGPGIAQRLGWASVSNITDIEFSPTLCVVAPMGASSAKIDVSMPAVISCDKGNVKVRKANVKGIMAAKKATVQVLKVACPPSTIEIIGHSMPPSKPAGKSFQGGDSANEVARLLREEANIL